MSKKAYRYVIVESSGCLAEQCPPGAHMLDWSYFGPSHTWHVMDTRGEITGWAHGKYVDKGVKTDDGKYEAAS